MIFNIFTHVMQIIDLCMKKLHKMFYRVSIIKYIVREIQILTNKSDDVVGPFLIYHKICSVLKFYG